MSSSSPPAYSPPEGMGSPAAAAAAPAIAATSSASAAHAPTSTTTAQELLGTNGAGISSSDGHGDGDAASNSQSGNPDKKAAVAQSDELYPDGDREKVAFTEEELQVDESTMKKLLWKVDVALVPYFSLLYLLSFLDRVNVGQANVAGLTPALGLKGNDYAVALSIFFVAYVVVEIPSNWLLKWLKPHRFVPIIMISWSIVMVLMGIVVNAAGLQATRFFLGIAEGGLFPGLNVLLSTWYPRSKLNLRVGLFFAGATLAGAFGGILAYGLKHIRAGAYDTALQGWRWIFIIEGLLTFVCALPGWYLIVDFPDDKQSFLDAKEAAQWKRVLETSQGLSNAALPFSWKQVRQAFKDWKLYVYSIMYLAIANPLYSLALFTPTIIADLHVAGAAAPNLLSTPPYALGFITTILAAVISDRYLCRSIPIIVCMTVTLIGYIIIICDVSAGVKYFALFLCVAGVSPSIALAISWIGSNYGPVYTRATAMGLFFSMGNSAGLVSSNVYPKTESPRYIKGHSINLAFTALAILCAVVLAVENKRLNRMRDRIHPAKADGSDVDIRKAGEEEEKRKWGLQGMSQREIVELGDRHPGFRYVW